MFAVDHISLENTPIANNLVNPAAFVQTLSADHPYHKRHRHHHGHHHGHPGHIHVLTAEQYRLKHHLRVARSEITDQKLKLSSAADIQNAYAIINETPLAPTVMDKDIARNFRPKFAERLGNLFALLKQTGFPAEIGSGTRRVTTQNAIDNPQKAKHTSLHEKGYAADILPASNDRHSLPQFFRMLHKLAKQVGLQTVPGAHELPHVQLAHNEIDVQGYAPGVLSKRPYGRMALASIAVDKNQGQQTNHVGEGSAYAKIRIDYTNRAAELLAPLGDIASPAHRKHAARLAMAQARRINYHPTVLQKTFG